MLGFIVFCLFFAVFALPLTIFSFRSRNKEFRQENWGGKLKLRIGWLAFGIVLFMVMEVVFRYWIEASWFEELGQLDRFWTVFFTKLNYFLIGGGVIFTLYLANLLIAHKTIAKHLTEIREATGLAWVSSKNIPRQSHWIVAIIAGIANGIVCSSAWEKILLYYSGQEFGILDPVFSQDVSFYVFSLPFYQFMVDFLFYLFFFTLLILAIYYLTVWYLLKDSLAYHDRKNPEAAWKSLNRLGNRGITHLAIVGIFVLLAMAANTRISIWEVLFSTRGAVFGAGYTDTHWQIPCYWIYIGALGVAVICLIWSAIAQSTKKTAWLAGAGFGTAILTYVFVVLIIPAVYQAFWVEPNELQKETPFIKRNISFTRQAYQLAGEHMREKEFPVNKEIGPEILKTDRVTLDNIRLWDWRVLQSNNNQSQAIRPYYNFPDIDVVRYNINGRMVQLMCAARELSHSRLSEGSRTWQNQRLVYTHGYGAVANMVNSFTKDGGPDYWLKDIPPKASFPELEIENPRIYFGKETNEHVFVKTLMPEFDFPQGDSNATFSYGGPAGIVLDSWLKKFAAAWRFDGLRLLMSNEMTKESRLLFRRDIYSRVKTLAPFLAFDDDPYQVIAGGKLWYMWDAYTTSTHYPYSEPYGPGKTNYVRNSVKVTIDAYTGEVRFYVFDPDDPIILAWNRIFTGMFQPAKAMPDELKAHIRYPEDYLRLQGLVYARYHMTNPTVFYNKEDAWEIAKELQSQGKVEEITPYYVVMKLPGEEKEEYVQILPFTPLTTDQKSARNNIIGWLAGRCDPEHYGELIVYKFPKDRLVFGPLQWAARMNQDDVISKDLNLWNQQGSKVRLANFLVIPLTDYRLLYVQPIYLEAKVSTMPELVRVMVAIGDEMAYAPTFEEALAILLKTKTTGVRASAFPSPEKSPEKSQTDLVKDAARHLGRYKELMGQGKFSEAGREMEELGRIINDLLK